MIITLKGSVTYTPRIHIDQETQQLLTDILCASDLIEEPENPEILCDWLISSNDGTIPTQEIALFRDGDDGEEPAFLFYLRRGKEEFMHIPSPTDQYKLRKMGIWYLDYTGTPYTMLVAYIKEIIEIPTRWHTLHPHRVSQEEREDA